MNPFGVSRKKLSALREEMNRLGVREEDIDETFTRSAGPGGQNANKVATRVRLRHRPSGTAVTTSRERSRALNRFFARRSLLKKIAGVVDGENSAERIKARKIAKQKKRRKAKTAARLREKAGPST